MTSATTSRAELGIFGITGASFLQAGGLSYHSHSVLELKELKTPTPVRENHPMDLIFLDPATRCVV